MAGLAGSLPKWDKANWGEALKMPLENHAPNIRSRIRRHRKCIEQYVKGIPIQGNIGSRGWYDATKPQFYASHEYRVKEESLTINKLEVKKWR